MTSSFRRGRSPAVSALLAAGLLAGGLLEGCTYRVHLDSLPAGATVETWDGRTLSTPDDVTVHFAPWFQTKRPITVTAPGYRTVTINLREREATFWHALYDVMFHPLAPLKEDPPNHLQVVMTPDHGPAGTWTPEGEGLE